jgi:uncharacterized protein
VWPELPFFKRRPPARRVFFATDIHGSELCFRKWISAARVYEASILVLGGDITGKLIVPIVQEDGVYTAELFQQPVVARGDRELEDLVSRIRQMGRYDAIMSAAEKSRLESDPIELDRLFHKVTEESLRRWIALADDRLDGTNTSAFVMLGNDDFPELAEALRSGTRVLYGEDKVLDAGAGFEILSFGFSTPTPWDSPREISEEEMASRLETLASQAHHLQRTIFNIHCPPRDTLLDKAPRLDSEMRPVVTGGGIDQMSAGSSAVRQLILSRQPALGLHGHVHESAGVDRLSRTLCINPGSEYSDGILRGAIVDLGEDGSIARWQMVQA